MKGMKGKVMKKLKSIKPISYPKLDRVLSVNASDGFIGNLLSNSRIEGIKVEHEEKKMNQKGLTVEEPDIIDVEELMRDLEDEEVELHNDPDDKENVRPIVNSKVSLDTSEDCKVFKHTPLSEIDVSTFRRPDLNSGSLFDPNLLAAFEIAVMEHKRAAQILEENLEKYHEEPPLQAPPIEENNNDNNPLLCYEEKCPPGGGKTVIFYTTSLRGIRKTFEDCNSIRFLLESFGVMFFERDVSMHLEFKEELWRTLRDRLLPPRLFIMGRYIGGVEEVLGLHEQGKLRRLFDGVPLERSRGPCEGCARIRFVMCYKCSGSRKIVMENGFSMKCEECNENGLILCPICC